MSIYQVSWSAGEPVGSAVERLILTRIASQTGGGGRDEPDPCQFVIAVDDHVDHDGVDVASVLHALVGLQRRGLIVDVRHDGGFVTGALVCPIRLSWVEAERVRAEKAVVKAAARIAEQAAAQNALSALAGRRTLRSRPPGGVGTQMSTAHLQVHDLAIRDGWSCYLCHEPLADVCTHNGALPRELHAWLPQREHVVPRALGGLSTLLNLRLACWPCNARKGAQ